MDAAQSYWCSDRSCKFHEISSRSYMICTDCYERDGSECKHDDEDEYDLFVQKLENSLTIIRLAVLPPSKSLK